jgi:hypothetical protein
MSNVVVLQVIHKMCSITLYLFIACYSTEDNFCKTLCHECSEANTTNGTIILNKSQGFMFPETFPNNIKKRMFGPYVLQVVFVCFQSYILY